MQKNKIVQLIESVMEATSIKVNLEHKRHPTPHEVAVEIAEFFLRLAKEEDHESKKEEKKANDTKAST